MKRAFKDWLMVLGLLVDEAAATIVLLFILRVFNLTIPLWLIIVLALALGGVAFLFHRKVIPTFRRKRITGAEGMIGLEGKVIEPLCPAGTVRVKGEYWQAECLDGDVPAGNPVEICGLNGLVLKVKPKK